MSFWGVLQSEQQLWDPFHALQFQPGPGSDQDSLPYSYRNYTRRLSSLHDRLLQHGAQHVQRVPVRRTAREILRGT